MVKHSSEMNAHSQKRRFIKKGQRAQFARSRTVGKVLFYASHPYYPDRGLENLEKYACNVIEEKDGTGKSDCIEERELGGVRSY